MEPNESTHHDKTPPAEPGASQEPRARRWKCPVAKCTNKRESWGTEMDRDLHVDIKHPNFALNPSDRDWLSSPDDLLDSPRNFRARYDPGKNVNYSPLALWSTAVYKSKAMTLSMAMLQTSQYSLLSRLCWGCISTMKQVLHVSQWRTGLSETIRMRLDKSRSILILWSDGHGFVEGNLNDKIAKYPLLRRKLSEFLISIGTTLSTKILPALWQDYTVQGRLLQALAEEAEVVAYQPFDQLTDSDDEDDDEDDGDSDNESDDSKCSNSEPDMNGYVSEIEADIECLLDLQPLIRTPRLELRTTTVEESLPLKFESLEDPSGVYHLIFIDLIQRRFPKAPSYIVACLATAYTSRLSKHLQLSRGKSLSREQMLGETDEGMFVSVKLHCDNNGDTRIPFFFCTKPHTRALCTICNKVAPLATNSLWEAHAFNDMKVWICHEEGCSCGSYSFATTVEWAAHLETEHAYGTEWPSITCAFCGEETESGRSSIFQHLELHMREACLDATEAVVGYRGLPIPLHEEVSESKSSSQSDEEVLFKSAKGAEGNKEGGIKTLGIETAQQDVHESVQLGASHTSFGNEESTEPAERKETGERIVKAGSNEESPESGLNQLSDEQRSEKRVE